MLGWNYGTSTTDGHISRVNDTCYDVPLLSSLQCLLQNTSVVEQVFEWVMCDNIDDTV